jgi:hypothetical protein
MGDLNIKKQPFAGYLLIIRKELEEAEDGWMKNIEENILLYQN